MIQKSTAINPESLISHLGIIKIHRNPQQYIEKHREKRLKCLPYFWPYMYHFWPSRVTGSYIAILLYTFEFRCSCCQERGVYGLHPLISHYWPLMIKNGVCRNKIAAKKLNVVLFFFVF